MRSGVWKSWWAQSGLGFRSSWVWDFPILHDLVGTQARETTALLFRARLGPEGSAGTVVAVVPDCAAPGSIGGRSLQLAVNVGVAVWVIVPVLRENGERYLRASRRCGVPLW